MVCRCNVLSVLSVFEINLIVGYVVRDVVNEFVGVLVGDIVGDNVGDFVRFIVGELVDNCVGLVCVESLCYYG